MQFRVMSLGSIWEIDTDLNRYRRYPRKEKPRDDASWGSAEAGPLQDFVWHEMPDEPSIVRYHPGLDYWDVPGALRIPCTSERATPLGRGAWVHAPLEQEELDRVEQLLS